MATLEDVAKHAGVSIMTVSRYVNESGYVGEKSKIKIKSAVEALNYRPNMIAKSLITKKTKTIGLIIASIINPFYPDVVLGVEDESYERGYNVILCNADGKKKEQEYIELLLEKCVDGIIFSHLNIGMKQLMSLKSENVACVLIGNEFEGLHVENIKTDDVLGGFLATEHLIQLGHRQIACIHGSLHVNADKSEKRYEETFQFNIWNNRIKGFIQAMDDAGLKINPSFVVEGDGTAGNGVEGGYNAMKAILKLVDQPTAIYAQNDLMAVGAMNAIHEAGFQIPTEYSIVGHDGIPLSDWVYPKLTTILQPRYDLGRASAKMLIDINENREHSYENRIMKPKLVVKSSTCEPIKLKRELNSLI